MRSIVPILAVLLCTGAFAAPQLTPALDLSAKALPPAFVPDDPQTVFNQFSPPKKGEFETDAQYEARVEKPPLKSFYAFSFDLDFRYLPAGSKPALPDGAGLAAYDADAQQFIAMIQADTHSDTSVRQDLVADRTVRSLPLRVVKKRDRDYRDPFTNLYANDEVYALVIPKQAWGGLASRIELAFEVPPDESGDAKWNLALLVIASPPSDGSPLVSTGRYQLTATPGHPVSGIANYDYLRLQPKSIWAYNKKTGTVYAKFDDGLAR
jgi:hypothetical protein